MTEKEKKMTSGSTEHDEKTVSGAGSVSGGGAGVSDVGAAEATNCSIPENWLARVATVWGGFAFTSFAGTAASYAAVWYVTETTASPLALALVYICAFLPLGLLAPLGGVLADRVNRRRIVIACDMSLSVTAAILGIVIAVGHASLLIIMLMCTLFGVEQAFRSPAFNAAMPQIVPEDQLMRINMLDSLLSSISMIAAPALGIVLYTTLGFQSVMFLDAIGALTAAAAMFAVRIPSVPAAERVRDGGVLANLGEGWQALSGNTGLLFLVLGITMGMMAYGPIDSLLPLMVASTFSGNGFMASLVSGVFGAGMLVGVLVLMARSDKGNLAHIIIGAAAVVGIVCTVAGLLPHDLFPAFVTCMGVMAMACAGFNGPLMTLLQKNVAPEKLGRVMGLNSALIGLGVPTGTALGGMLAESIGVAAFFTVDGLVIVALAVGLAVAPGVRALDCGNEDCPGSKAVRA